MKKGILKVISVISLFMFTFGFATHAYMAANNIELTKPKTAYAMTTDADTVINHAREYIGLSNSDIRSMGDKYLCDSAWCASFISLIMNETNVPNSVPDYSPYGVRPDIRVDEYVKYYMDEGRFHLNQSASSDGFTTANDEYISHEALEACRDGYFPKKGDLIIFDWGDEYGRKDGNPDHIAFFVSCENNRLLTVEGNPGSAEWEETRVSELDNDFNFYNEYFIFGYITPHYSEETTEERIEREAREKEENIQSIAEFAVNMTENTFEAMYEILNDNKFTVTFDPGDVGSVDQQTATVYKNACPIYPFPSAVPYTDTLSFVKWVDENGEEYNHNSIFTSDITLYAEYTDENKNRYLHTPRLSLGEVTWNIENEAPSFNTPLKIRDDGEGTGPAGTSSVTKGDINDDARIDAIDACHILNAAALLSTGGSVDEKTYISCDVDNDSVITSNDAAITLSFYSYLMVNSEEEKMSFDEYLTIN